MLRAPKCPKTTLYKTVDQQRCTKPLTNNAVQNPWPTSRPKPLANNACTKPLANNACTKPLANKLSKTVGQQAGKAVGQQAVQNLSANELSRTHRPTSCLKPTPHCLQRHRGQTCRTTSCPKPVGQQAVQTCRTTNCPKPVGQQAVSNQPLIVSNGTGANQPPPN